VAISPEDTFLHVAALEHHEPILLVGIPETKLIDFTHKYQGIALHQRIKVGGEGSKYPNGDAHHPHMSIVDGHYDGKYLFINDKANTRIARIRCDVMKTDKIIDIPNAHAMHGLRVQKVPYTQYVFCYGEYEVPLPNDGTVLDDPSQYVSLFNAIDAEKMEVAFQVIVNGNLDNTDADYTGKYVASTSYSSEMATNLSGMITAERDHVVVFNIPRIDAAIAAGQFKLYNGVKVLDGRKGSELKRYIPVPKSPHGINTSPGGEYFIANGRLSSTVSIIAIDKLDALFADQIDARDTIVDEPELGTFAEPHDRTTARLHYGAPQ
jgi:nitrous-oxide reductase